MGTTVSAESKGTATSDARRPTGAEERDLRLLLEALTAVRDGDFRARLRVGGDSTMAAIASVFNEMVERNRHMASEFERVRRAVGRDGRLTERLAPPKGGPWTGAWQEETDAANRLLDDLVRPTVEVGRVLSAVAGGDLSHKIDTRAGGDPLRGEFLRVARTVNGLVDRLSAFTTEVTRVAREVGTEGNLGAQAQVRGVCGAWKALTDSVNSMASNLAGQVRDIALVTTAVATGDLSRKVTIEVSGEMLQLKSTVNTMVDQLSAFASEVTRVAREVGTEGNLGGQALVRGISGTWKDLTDSVNSMASNLTAQVRDIARVSTAVARGDLTQKITVDARGEILELKNTINTMVDQLSAFADEVTRVAREVGTEGNLGGQAAVPNVAGTWKDLTESVNVMADNLTSQVRSIAEVTTAVARGDLTQKIDVAARGEILELKTTINTMVDTLRAFADEVTRVAREVGSEGRLGGQAEVEGVSGTWDGLTESVNELAGNLTTQVRAIAEVATAVTLGDLTRQITVDASGEVAELKDNINQMIANLRETTRANWEQDWFKTNLARISGLMQGHRDLTEVAQLIMNELTPVVGAQQGAFFFAVRGGDGAPVLRQIAGYAHTAAAEEFRFGESLVGQAALEKRRIVVTDAPAGYLIRSGLGEGRPATVVVMPVLFEGNVLAVIELASFRKFSEVHLAFLDQLMETIGVIVNTIIANSRTEALLAESQRLTRELQERSEQLQAQQEELRHTNTELEEKAALLAAQNRAIETQNFEIEQARQSLEDRAEQLAVSSRYKSEFLANMSHELRTPLNSLLILARLLADNPAGNLTAKQVEFATVIHSAGSDLLQLINDILDLSKVEAGKMDVRPGEVPLAQLVEYVEATFRPQTVEKGLRFTVSLQPGVPATLYTDQQRLQQVLRNLLSNAVKFTESGEVNLTISRVEDAAGAGEGGGAPDPDAIVAFSVTDTGIGIAEDKLQTIFDAFQQADGTTSRKYGGTGLGLWISREIARLIGGEIHAHSVLSRGSTFTLTVPAALRAGGEAPRLEVPVVNMPLMPDVEVDVRAPAILPEEPDGSEESERGGAGAADDAVDEDLRGARLLIVDDDVRNVFALTSALEQHGMEVLYAENGQAAITLLDQNPDTDLVLMDIMMPGVDGYATTGQIRQRPEFAGLPIVALTAKAMKGDREKALAAGASDYVAKPVQVSRLLDVIRSWLARGVA